MAKTAKRIWAVSIQQVYEGYFYVAADSRERARDLAWTHMWRGNELRCVGNKPGYVVEARPADEPLEEEEGGVDVDQDDPAYSVVHQVPVWFYV